VTTPPVHPVVDRAAAYSWRLLVVAALVVGALWLAGELLVVVVPLAVAILATRVLVPPAAWLRRRGWPRALATTTVVLGGLLLVVAVLGAAGARTAGQLDDLNATLTDAVDDIEDWLVDDSPFDLQRADVDAWRQRVGDAFESLTDSSGGSLASGAALAAEVVVGILLAIVVTFFLVKDGDRFAASFIDWLPSARRPVAAAMGRRSWAALGGYLRGAAALGAVEAAIIGGTLLVVGAELVVTVMVLTFLGAFVPIAGAIVAGVVAVLVALVTAGPAAAVIVAVVAIVVQQLDNDLLAPVIYGRALRLHPLVILIGITAGGALFGIVGTVLAVPVLAVAFNVADELRHHRGSVGAVEERTSG
jgi:predicted PurR-regulated permease PerM